MNILESPYTNEHEPIHVHGRHAGRESRAEIIVQNGQVVGVQIGDVAAKRPLEDEMNSIGSTPKFLEITEAEYLSEYKIRLRFSDGKVRVVDFGPFLANQDTTDYRDLERFKSFRIEDGDLMWGDFRMIFPIIDLYNGQV